MRKILWCIFVLTALSAAGEVILRKQGLSVTLKCKLTNSKSNLEWLHGNERIYRHMPNGLVSKGKSNIASRAKVDNEKLEIREVKDSDAGKFTCKINGKPQEYTLLVISISASPSGDLQLGGEAVLQCQVEGLIPGTTVQWRRPDGSLHAGSKVVLKPVAHSDAGIWNCTFSHDGVTYSEDLNIKVTERPTTLAPLSPKSSVDIPKPPCKNCVTNAPVQLGLSWWVWVVIGVGCLLLVLLMVFIICLCKRIKRKKRKLRKMKNGHQLLSPKQYCQCNCPTAAAKPQQRRRREKPSAPPLPPLLMD